MATLEGQEYILTGRNVDLGTLSAPGSTDVVRMHGSKGFMIQYTVATINTSLVVKAEGSVDNSTWFDLSEDESAITKTANGTYAMLCETEVPFVRFTFVSEVGGTAATIAVLIFPLKSSFTMGGGSI